MDLLADAPEVVELLALVGIAALVGVVREGWTSTARMAASWSSSVWWPSSSGSIPAPAVWR